MRLTPGDFDVVRFVGRHRFATAAQVARAVGRTEKKIYPRLLGLRSAGLVTFERPLIASGVYLATRQGLAAVGLTMPPATIELATFIHDRTVTDVAAGLEADDGEVISEREMRSWEENPDNRDSDVHYALTLPGGGRHYPDLLVGRPSGRWQAIEVELTRKPRQRRERILTGYATARHIEGVVYLVDGRGIGELVRRSAQTLGLADLVVVRTLTEQEAAA